MNSLVDYEDSPAPGRSDPSPQAGDTTLLSIVDYSAMHDDAPPASQDLGVSLDDDEIIRPASKRVGSVQVSVVKRAKAHGDSTEQPAPAANTVPACVFNPRVPRSAVFSRC